MWVNLQSIGKNVFTSKNEQIKMILMNHGKPELSDGLSAFYSPRMTSQSSVFRLFMNTNFHFGFSLGRFYFLLPHFKQCAMPIGLNLNWIPSPMVALVFHAFIAFSVLVFLKANYFIQMRWLHSLTTVYLQVSLSSCLQHVSWNNTPLDYSVRVIYPRVPNGTNLSCIL